MGVAKQCCGRSMAFPGLMNLWLGWAALPDQRTAILGIVDIDYVVLRRGWT